MIRSQILQLKHISGPMHFQLTKLFIFGFLVLFTFNYNTQAQNSDKFKVVIDAGHGGEDSGVNKMGVKEKDITLRVSLFIEEFLNKQSGIELIYTRTEDEFIGLKERAKLANDENVDLFVSIHCSSNEDSDVYGVETYFGGLHKSFEDHEIVQRENNVIFLEKNFDKTYRQILSEESIVYSAFKPWNKERSVESQLVANLIQKNLTENLNRNNLGVKEANFLVLNEINMPGVLVNIGHLSNVEESYYVSIVSHQKRLAEQISNAILEYKAMSTSGNSNFEVEETVQADVDAVVVETPVVVEEPKKVEKPNAPRPVYYVQILAANKQVELTPENFRGLNEITSIEEDYVFKYRYGKSSSYLEILEYLDNARAQGYKDAYVVVYLDGKRISIEDALKLGGE